MNENNEWWNFLCWKQFNKKVFKQTITQQDLKGKKFYLESVSEVKPDGTVEECSVNTNVYKFDKEGELYLIEEKDIPDLPLNPTEVRECYLKESDKTIYKFIVDSESARITPQKTKPFKQFIQEFNPVDHTNQRTRIFLNLIAIASRHKPIKITLCSEPAGLKTANYNIMQYITNEVIKLNAPTRAKLETALFFYKVLLIEEMTSVGAAEVRILEPIFLTLADESPELEKHSVAQNKAMNQMDLEETSIIFPYNRVEDLRAGSKFFTQIWKSWRAFESRFPSLLLEGKVESKIKKLNVKGATKIVEDNWDAMRDTAKNVLYFTKHLDKEMHHYENRNEIDLPYGRQYPNFEGILDCIDAFCDSQAEFDDWIKWINERFKAYREMISAIGEVTAPKLETTSPVVEEDYITEDTKFDKAYDSLDKMFPKGVPIESLQEAVGIDEDDFEKMLKNFFQAGEYMEVTPGFVKRL